MSNKPLDPEEHRRLRETARKKEIVLNWLEVQISEGLRDGTTGRLTMEVLRDHGYIRKVRLIAEEAVEDDE